MGILSYTTKYTEFENVIHPLWSIYGIVSLFCGEIQTLRTHMWWCNCVFTVGRWQTWMSNCCRSRGACLELQWARSRRPPACCACLPVPAFLLGYSASVRRLAAMPCPGEEFIVRTRRRMMRGPCQSLISFCSAVRQRHVILLESERGPKDACQ